MPPGEERRSLRRRPRHFHDLRPHLVFPPAVASGGEDDLAVLHQDEAGRAVTVLGALVAHLEVGEDPECFLWPTLFLEDQVAVGRVDHDIVDLLEGFGLQQRRFRLGTPDLAAASKFVANEHQRGARRLAGLARQPGAMLGMGAWPQKRPGSGCHADRAGSAQDESSAIHG